MLLETLINPKPKTTVYFAVISFLFLAIPSLDNNLVNSHTEFPYPYLIFFSSIFILLLHAFGLNNLIYNNNIIKKENLIIATVFISLNTFNIGVFKDIISSFLLLFFVNKLFESYQKEYPFNEIFICSLIISLLVIINSIMVLLLPLIVISGLIFNFSNWRCYIVSLIGLSMPLLVYVIIMSLVGDEITPFKYVSCPIFSDNIADLMIFYKANIWVANIFIIITTISLFEFFNWLYKKSIRSRKSFFILLSFLIISIAIGIFGNEKNWYIVLAPISVFIANYFTYTKKRNLANILFYVFIFTSLYYRCMIII
ncbi:hypothetical protein N9O83_01080 [Flavobacteriales bacterium]|nr:hypothetical protein [Flavobacteriales bacterium]